MSISIFTTPEHTASFVRCANIITMADLSTTTRRLLTGDAPLPVVRSVVDLTQVEDIDLSYAEVQAYVPWLKAQIAQAGATLDLALVVQARNVAALCKLFQFLTRHEPLINVQLFAERAPAMDRMGLTGRDLTDTVWRDAG